MSGADPGRGGNVSAEQLRYARVLGYGMKAGLAILAAGFVAYASGWLPALVPLEALPRLWGLPVHDYLGESGMPAGWTWFSHLGRGDALVLGGIALLSGVSVPCLLVLVPAYARRRDRAYMTIALATVGVLALAASGVFGTH